jgi:hypothetical protein
MSTYPLASDILCEQLDVYMLKSVEAARKLRILRTYRPEGGTIEPFNAPALEAAITRAEIALAQADAITADIRGAIKKLRTP